MAPTPWMKAVLPCLYPRHREQQPSETVKSLQSVDTTPVTGVDDDDTRKQSVFKASPEVHDGLEPVILPERSRPQTILMTELPCPTPRRPDFHPDAFRPVVGRSRSDGPAYKKKDNKGLKGKRKRSQTFNISGPSEARRGACNDPKLTFPLTYPSPSRQRPEKFTLDRMDTNPEEERPRTAPSAHGLSIPTDSLSLRSANCQVRNHAWRLAPLPPMPALQINNDIKGNINPSTESIKRKPVPLRIRGASDPSPGSPRMSTTHDNLPSNRIGCAVEMPGSIPPTTSKSPVELAAATTSWLASPGSSVDADTPLVDMDSIALEAAMHTALSSLPASPTSPIYAHRLSEGARDLLNFFPTTPKVGMSRADSTKSIKSIKSTRRAASAEPPLSPRLVEFAELKKLPIAATAIVTKASEIKIQQVVIKPLNLSRKTVRTDTLVSPSAISPRTQLPASRIKASPPLYAPMTPDRSLPPTPETAGFSRGRFISLAAGLEVSEIPGFELAGLGIATEQESSRKSSAAESIQIFFAPTSPVQG